MNVLLINPPLNSEQPFNGAYPMGIGYIGAMLRRAQYHVEVLDIRLFKYKRSYVSEFLSKNREKYDLYGISAMVTMIKYTQWLAREIKRNNRKSIVVVGGSISTAAEILLNDNSVDIVCIGEGEKVVVDIADSICKNKDLLEIPNIKLKRDDKVKYTGSTEPLNIDDIPFPAWDLFDMSHYTKNQYIVPVDTPSITMISERGCPFECSFCYRNFGRKVRHRSPELVVAEIKSAIEYFGIGHIDFLDEIFNVSPKNVKDLCSLIIKEGLNITWRCIGRTDLVDKETLQIMYEAGCKWIGYGVESGSQDMLDKMNKKQKVEKIEQSIKLSRDVGMIVTGTFIIGMPGETERTIKESKEFYERNQIFNVPFFPIPYPGTKLFDECIRNNLIGNIEEYIMSLDKDATELIINMSNIPDGMLIEHKKNLIEQFSKYIPNMRLA